MDKKRCNQCGIVKELSEFGYNKVGGKSYLRGNCKACQVNISVAYYKKHPEKKRKADKLYNERHKEKISEKNRLNRLANPELKRERDRKYAAEHREHARIKAAKWYAENKERASNASKIYREKNKEAIKAKKSAYNKINSVQKNAREHRRRANKKGNGGIYTKQEFTQLCEKYDNQCLMCKRKDVKLTVDHIIPIVLGGSNFIENIQPLCVSCNSKKHDKILDLRY